MDDPETRLYTAARHIKNDQAPRQRLQRPGPDASQDEWDDYLCAVGENAMDADDFRIWLDA